MNDTVSTDSWKNLPSRYIKGFSHVLDEDDNRRFLTVTYDALAVLFPTATDMWSTSSDMTKLLHFLLAGDEKILPKRLHSLLFKIIWESSQPLDINAPENTDLNDSRTGQARSTAFEVLERRYAFLGGHMEGYLSSLLLDPKGGLGVVLLANTMDAPIGLDTVLEIVRSLDIAQSKNFGDAALHPWAVNLPGVYETRTGSEAIVRIGDGLVRHDYSVLLFSETRQGSDGTGEVNYTLMRTVHGAVRVNR
jgi:CubicO group peptidase (beta-lactamase class C family)